LGDTDIVHCRDAHIASEPILDTPENYFKEEQALKDLMNFLKRQGRADDFDGSVLAWLHRT